MFRTPQITSRSGWWQDLNSMLISALCHLGLLIALGLATIATQEKWGGVKLFVHAGEGQQPVESLDETPLEATVEFKATPEPAAALGPTRLFDEIAVPTADFAALTSFSENATDASGFEGLALGGKSEADGADGHTKATEFFGIGGYGQSFVYVVDCSDSMNEGGKFERARYELLRSIEQLSKDQKYFIIFFNHGAYPMDGEEMVPATEEQFAKTVEWVDYAVPDGGTNPLPALLYALSMKPDAIYFLSDGQFDPHTIKIVRQQNRESRREETRRIPIHTIAFVDRMTEYLMRTIARHSGGEYRFVP